MERLMARKETSNLEKLSHSPILNMNNNNSNNSGVGMMPSFMVESKKMEKVDPSISSDCSSSDSDEYSLSAKDEKPTITKLHEFAQTIHLREMASRRSSLNDQALKRPHSDSSDSSDSDRQEEQSYENRRATIEYNMKKKKTIPNVREDLKRRKNLILLKRIENPWKRRASEVQRIELSSDEDPSFKTSTKQVSFGLHQKEQSYSLSNNEDPTRLVSCPKHN